MSQLPELDKVREALSGFADMVNTNASGMSELAREEAEAAKKIKEFADLQKKLIDQAGKTLGSLGTAIMDSKSGFAKYNETIDKGTDVLKTFLESIPIFGKALGTLVGATAAVAKQFTEQADNVTKANNSLKQLGTAGSFTGTELLQMGHKVGLTSKNLDTLVKPIQSLGSGILALGNNTGEGAINFAKIVEVTGETRKQFQRLGVSQEQLMQNAADYITLQQTSASLTAKDIKDTKRMQELTLEYTQNLQVLSAITGKSAEEVKKQQQEAANDRRFQVSQILLENKARKLESEGRTEEAAKVRREKEGRKQLLDMMSAQMTPSQYKQFAGVLATGGKVSGDTKEMAQLMGKGFNVQGLLQDVREGKDVKDVAAKGIKELNNATMKWVSTVGEGMLFKEKIGDVFLGGTEEIKKANLLRDNDLVKTQKEVQAKLAKAQQEHYDKLADADAMLTEAARQAAIALDEMVEALNPLLDAKKVEGTPVLKTSQDKTNAEMAAGADVVSGVSVTGEVDLTGGAGSISVAPAATPAKPSASAKPVKSSEASLRDAGLVLKKGDVHKEGTELDPRLIDIAKQVQSQVPGFMQFTGFNDRFHTEKAPASKHTMGKAFDFTVSKKPTKEEGEKIIGIMKNLGIDYAIDEYNNPSSKATAGHFHGQLNDRPKAAKGGIFSGSKSGYPVELHGKELVAPLTPGSLLSKLVKTSESETNKKTSNTSSDTGISEMVAMMSVFVQKMDDVISTLKASKGVQDKLLQYSKT